MISQENKVRVLHIITSLDIGGAEMMLFKLLSNQAKHTDSFVITLIEGGKVAQKISAIGIPVYSLSMESRFPSLSVLKRLKQLINQIQPGLIQGWMYHGNLAASLAGLINHRKIPVIWNIRHSLYDLKLERFTTRQVIRLNAILSKQTHTIIYNSRASAQQHQVFGFDASKTVVIPNGFDTKSFRPHDQFRIDIRDELGLNKDAFLIGLIGRYHPMKDHRNFIKSAALLHITFPDVHYLLVGEGVVSGNIKINQMREFAVVKDVCHLMGAQNDMPKIMASLDICVSSSLSEAFPNVIGEAMACGVPCVVTDVGDSAWIVGDTGKVVPPSDPDAMAKALKFLIEAGEAYRKSLGKMAMERVRAHFSITSVADSYNRLYQSIISS